MSDDTPSKVPPLLLQTHGYEVDGMTLDDWARIKELAQPDIIRDDWLFLAVRQ